MLYNSFYDSYYDYEGDGGVTLLRSDRTRDANHHDNVVACEESTNVCLHFHRLLMHVLIIRGDKRINV